MLLGQTCSPTNGRPHSAGSISHISTPKPSGTKVLLIRDTHPVVGQGAKTGKRKGVMFLSLPSRVNTHWDPKPLLPSGTQMLELDGPAWAKPSLERIRDLPPSPECLALRPGDRNRESKLWPWCSFENGKDIGRELCLQPDLAWAAVRPALRGQHRDSRTACMAGREESWPLGCHYWQQ